MYGRIILLFLWQFAFFRKISVCSYLYVSLFLDSASVDFLSLVDLQFCLRRIITFLEYYTVYDFIHKWKRNSDS